ncbi:hypothetical protein OG252_44745 [Streptomyces sp. NBC_01352]|uniref:hypothetical protein n=1 Tax=Streptomyces sp. NBC_01352 TaxID=2903834 RepID=UPI002E3200D3|nr:hypothetical protein [Streptomyces sp. NBC_01352]
METWYTGRVVLLGDSAWCLTLYSGMGASTALVGTDLLGTLLQRNGGNTAWMLRLYHADGNAAADIRHITAPRPSPRVDT